MTRAQPRPDDVLSARPATPPTRRRVLGGGAGLLGAIGAVGGATFLAGCGSDEDTPSGSGQRGGSGEPLAKVADIPVGQAVSAKDSSGDPLLISRPKPDTVVAFSAICTHKGCTVQPAGHELHCPCHGSRYAVATGKVLHGPAPRPLERVRVHVVSGEVMPGA